MKKNPTELVFILDRSGSMQGLESDTIGGFNAMLEKQKREPGEAFVSTILFDDWTEVLHDWVKVSEVKPITAQEYYVRCGPRWMSTGRTPSRRTSKTGRRDNKESARSSGRSLCQLRAWGVTARGVYSGTMVGSYQR